MRRTNNASPKHFTVKMHLFLASQNTSYPLQISLPKDITVGDAIAFSVDEFNNKVTSSKIKSRPDLFQITKASPSNGAPFRSRGISTSAPSIKVFNPNHRLFDFGERNLCLMVKNCCESGEREVFVNTSS